MAIMYRTGVAFVAAFAVLAPLQAFSAESGVRVRIEGVGAAQCSEVATRLEKRPEAVVNQIAGWAYGYMSRRNIERGIAGQSQAELTPDNMDAAKLVTVIVGACEKTPDARLYQIVEALYEILLENGTLTS
jgi:hypothetical protein